MIKEKYSCPLFFDHQGKNTILALVPRGQEYFSCPGGLKYQKFLPSVLLLKVVRIRFQYRLPANTGIEKMGILEALDPAGNAKKNSIVKLVNFWQK